MFGISSMTGYGNASAKRGDATVKVEVKTVNHRFFDLHVRLAREYAALEPEIHQTSRRHIQRGRVDVNVVVQASAPLNVSIDRVAARSYFEFARSLREEFRFQDSLDLRTLLCLPGVLQNDEETGGAESVGRDVAEAMKDSLEQALLAAVRMRRQEGEALQAVMHQYLESLSAKTKAILALVPSSVLEYRCKLEKRLSQLLPPNAVDPQRLAQEVAIIVDRSDISEELSRLSSHLEQSGELLNSETEIGKKLDFLLQEMQREVNTLLSKTGNLDITRLGISMKADVEKLREQVQNIE